MNNEEKKKLTEKQIFWIRFAAWTLFACILPVVFIIWRYDLFRVVSKVQIGGWGLVALVIILVFAITLLKYFKSGMVKWSMTKQVINGLVKVILPLVSLFFVLNAIKDNINLFLQALGCAILCEFVAIPINPMPEWVYNQSQGKTEDTIDYFCRKIDEKQKKEETN